MDNEKIIIRTEFIEGGNLAAYDYSLLSSVKVVKTKVVLPIFTKGSMGFIGVKDPLLPQEVIQVGNLGFKYKIIGPLKQLIPTGGFVYRIKRIDGYNITSTDITATAKGGLVKIKSRRTFEQLMGY
jgi:hypothetical protein